MGAAILRHSYCVSYHPIQPLGAQMLPPDDPYRHIGDMLYAELYAEYAADLAAIPAPAGLATFDLAVIFALQQQE